jgi:hypothetical protein
MKPLEKLEAQLRTAVESRQYHDVERFLVEYCESARAHVRSLAPSDPALREAEKTIYQLLQWTARMLQAGRESIALELNRLPRLQRYLQTPPAAPSNWHVEG